MHQTDKKSMNKARAPAQKILDFFLGLLGSLIAGNLGLILFAQLDPQRIWTPYFKWFWILVLAVLAALFFTRKRSWISSGILAAAILMVF